VVTEPRKIQEAIKNLNRRIVMMYAIALVVIVACFVIASMVAPSPNVRPHARSIRPEAQAGILPAFSLSFGLGLILGAYLFPEYEELKLQEEGQNPSNSLEDDHYL